MIYTYVIWINSFAGTNVSVFVFFLKKIYVFLLKTSLRLNVYVSLLIYC